MKVGDKVRIRNPIPGGSNVFEGTGIVRELMYGDEWTDGSKAAIEFEDEPGKTFVRAIFEKDIVPKMEDRVGTEVQIMCHGHVVDAKITGVKEIFPGTPAGDPPCHEFECEFIAQHDTGEDTLCLDYGQNWYIKAGETFPADEKAIERAMHWMEKQKPTANQIADRIRGNIREWFNEQISDELFKKRASGLWDKARELGIDDDVLEIVCPKL